MYLVFNRKFIILFNKFLIKYKMMKILNLWKDIVINIYKMSKNALILVISASIVRDNVIDLGLELKKIYQTLVSSISNSLITWIYFDS